MIPIPLAIIAGGLIADGFRGAIQSSAIDQDVQKRNAKAFEKQVKAQELIREHQKRVDLSLQKAANRKNGILLSSMAELLDVYEKVKRIDFQPKFLCFKQLGVINPGVHTQYYGINAFCDIFCKKPYFFRQNILIFKVSKGRVGYFIIGAGNLVALPT